MSLSSSLESPGETRPVKGFLIIGATSTVLHRCHAFKCDSHIFVFHIFVFHIAAMHLNVIPTFLCLHQAGLSSVYFMLNSLKNVANAIVPVQNFTLGKPWMVFDDGWITQPCT